MSIYGMEVVEKTPDDKFTIIYACDLHSGTWQDVNKDYFQASPIDNKLSLPCVDCGGFATQWLVCKEFFV